MKQQLKKGTKNETGAHGEEIAVSFLMKHGFSILDTNYLKPWGEIDVIARKSNLIHFVEVKTVSYETKQLLEQSVSHGTWRPEENVTAAKVSKLNRVIETWLSSQNLDLDWQIDVIAVRIVPHEKYASVKYIPNIIIE